MQTFLTFRRLSVLGACLLAAAQLSGAAQPNILFIMSDDHTSTGIGCYGSRLAKLDPTPNIDKLAARGVRLDNCFCNNSICTPSRATIMTGQPSSQNGIVTLIGTLPKERQSLPLAMRDAGYETAMVGKWHLKAEPAAYDFYTVLPGQGWYHNPIFRVPGPQPWPKNEMRVKKHVSDAVTDISLRWLKSRKQKDKPFFLMHHFKAPHDDFLNAERYDFLYDDVTIPEPESLRDRGQHGPQGKPLYGTSVSDRNKRRNMGMHMFVDQDLPGEEYTTESYQRYLKKFLRCVRGVDDNVGRLLRYLDSTGELENTVVVYTADQGFMLGEHDYIDKRWMYEESQRMPFIVAGPELPKGQSNNDMITNVDFAPTLVDFGHGDVDAASAKYTFVGRSFKQNLVGQTPSDWPTAVYYRYFMHMAHHDNPAHFGIRTRDKKLIFFYGQPLNTKWFYKKDGYVPTEPHWELYDLAKDPHEMKNVYGEPEYATVQAELKAALNELRVSNGDADFDATYPAMQDVIEKHWD